MESVRFLRTSYAKISYINLNMPIRLIQVDALGCDPAHVRLPSDSVAVSASFP